MDDEIEDIVGEIKYTDSQKTIASVAYSLDFTDITSSSRGGSEKNLSSGKNTYVIECDSEDSDAMSPLHDCVSEKLNPLFERLHYTDTDLSSEITSTHHQSRQIIHNATTSYQTMTAKEIFTQTSKTIIELAETEGLMYRITGNNNLQTQTSFMSITENKTVEYKIELSRPDHFSGEDFIQDNCAITDNIKIEYPEDEESAHSADSSSRGSQVNFQAELSNTNDDMGDFQNSSLELENETPIYHVSETDNEIQTRRDKSDASTSRSESSDEKLQIIDDTDINKNISEAKFNIFSEHSSNEEYEEFPSDIEEDSLMQDSPKISENAEELREKISEVENCWTDNFDRPDIQRFGVLTPLTEEAIIRNSSMDITDHIHSITDNSVLVNDDLLYTNDIGIKVNLLKGEEGDSFKLPPIRNKPIPVQNQSFPNSPQIIESKNRWELSTKILAAGESTLIRGKNHPLKKRNQDDFHLPPISKDASSTNRSEPPRSTPIGDMTEPSQTICIKERIKELTTPAGRSKLPWSYKQPSRSQEHNRSSSASSTVSPGGRRDLATIAHLGCEAICLELLERLRSNSWSVVVETLEELPVALNKYWGNITEMRIADMLRQVNVHVESPRPQVARTACSTVAAILKNTRYTKKPDFYETVALLLTKTGSYSRLVRRAANVALDNIVCAVDMSHALAALTAHGVDHKNGLVRCAAARLLVVCCALGGAGRKLLKARPPSAATARKQTLRALAVLLDDKSKQTREYAERLYAMLRPLPNFEAYYLTDVDLETASRHMKKYDHILQDISNDAR